MYKQLFYCDICDKYVNINYSCDIGGPYYKCKLCNYEIFPQYKTGNEIRKIKLEKINENR